MIGFARNSRGAVSVPLLLITSILVGAMLTLLGLSLQWRVRVMTQKRVDDCVASHARDLRNTLAALEKGNARIRFERTSLLVALATQPGLVPTIRGIIQAEVLYQETLRAKWGLKQMTWIAKRGCDSKRDAFFPLPSMAWKRPPRDSLSELPLEWEPGRPKSLRIRLWSHPRYATALVENHEERWSARWISPTGK